MTVEELGKRMTLAEFTRWQVFDSREPIGERRLDQAVAMLCAMLAASHGAKGRAARPQSYSPKYAQLWGKRPSATALQKALEKQFNGNQHRQPRRKADG